MKLITIVPVFAVLVSMSVTMACAADTARVPAVLSGYERNTAFLQHPYSFDYKDSFGQFGSVHFSADRSRIVEHIFRGNQISDFSRCEILLRGRDGMIYERSPGDSDGTIFSSLAPRDFGKGVYNHFSYPFLLGLVPDGEDDNLVPIAGFLRASNLKFDGKDGENVCFQGKKDHYQVKACFDKNNNLVSLFYSSSRTAYTVSDLFYVHEYSLTFSNYSEMDGANVPQSASICKTLVLTKTVKTGGKDKQEPFIEKSPVKIEIALSNYVLNRTFSESDFAFTDEVKDGTPAVMEDALQIQYVWHDGKIVPKTDEVMLAIAQGGHKFMPGPDEPRFWLMGVGIALIVCSGGVKIYQYFKNRKDK